MAEAKKPTIIAVANYKGSAGKTMTAAELAYVLGSIGKRRVLAIDLDRQYDLSLWLKTTEPDSENPGISDVLLADENGNRMALADVIVHTEIENVDAVPSTDRHPLDIEAVQAQQEEQDFEARLKIALEELIDSPDHARYDYIIIDCPPSMPPLAKNAVNAVTAGSADSRIIIPMKPMYISRKSLEKISEDAEAASEKYQMGGIPINIVWTMVEDEEEIPAALAKAEIDDPGSKFEGVTEFETRIKAIDTESINKGFSRRFWDTEDLAVLHTMYRELAKEFDPTLPEN